MLKSNHRMIDSRTARRAVMALGWPVLILTTALGVARGEWPTHRGNSQRTGAADDQPGPKSPKVLWVHKTREHYVAAPVPGGKEVYLSSLGAFNTSRFDALAVDSAAPKRIVWSKSAPML